MASGESLTQTTDKIPKKIEVIKGLGGAALPEGEILIGGESADIEYLVTSCAD